MSKEKQQVEEVEEKVSYGYDVYNVTLRFGQDGVAGSLPMSNSIREDYARLLQAGASNELHKALGNKEQITEEDIQAYLEKTLTVFPVDDNGFYLREVQVISMLLNAATRTRLTVIRKGVRGDLTQGTTFIKPKRLYLTNGMLDLSPTPITGEVKLKTKESFVPNKKTGVPAPKSFQVLVGVKPISFELYCIKDGDIYPEDMKHLWEISQEIGLGGSRRLGYGKFTLNEFVHKN